ncbi:hypothetical protein CYMTET_4004 [Cymbomonas tetramitiformis]|uniref:Uncharacterized protein n=1 Tax=Cymbomonas tetramitiformis TaxID=36881 RepID=A0AAE0LKH1_9CHLO|nr:hypothetical protein CYMTET_4004 [Cymbomonas tetramitiformis]
MFCRKVFNGTPDRICAHVAGSRGVGIDKCPGIQAHHAEPDESVATRKQQFKDARSRCIAFKKERDAEREEVRARTFLDNATSTPGGAVPGGRKPGRRTSIVTALDTSKQQQADADLAMAFYEADIPFHVLEHPSVKVALRSVAAVGSSYTAPGRNAIGDTLLDSAHSKVATEIAEQRLPLRTFGTTVVSDGATDISKRPILNLLNVSPALVEFIKALNCEGKVCTYVVCEYIYF